MEFVLTKVANKINFSVLNAYEEISNTRILPWYLNVHDALMIYQAEQNAFLIVIFANYLHKRPLNAVRNIIKELFLD